jgi:hypothetical protein
MMHGPFEPLISVPFSKVYLMLLDITLIFIQVGMVVAQ